LHFITAIIVLAIGFIGSFNFIYWMGAIVFIGLLIYQHTLVKPNDISKVNMAFATTNGIASVVFAIFVMVALFMQ
jgi:4-hydroxybenzoate polyprenyltransferase